MIELDRQALIGKGLHRECFAHPDDPARCIKVVVSGTIDENRREAGYYSRLARRGICWDMLTRFYGLVPTNLGEGAVFDLVRDYDNTVSRTLAHYLESTALTERYGAVIRQALVALQAYLLRNRVITMTLKPKNILFQRAAESAGKLVIVDNIGNSDFLPIADYSAFFARRKIQRKWRRFEQSMRRDYSSNPELGKVLDAAPAG